MRLEIKGSFCNMCKYTVIAALKWQLYQMYVLFANVKILMVVIIVPELFVPHRIARERTYLEFCDFIRHWCCVKLQNSKKLYFLALWHINLCSTFVVWVLNSGCCFLNYTVFHF
jgi:hypothetical protein